MMASNRLDDSLGEKKQEAEMKNVRTLVIAVLVISLAILACSGLTPTETVPQVQANTPSEAGAQTAIPATSTAIPAPSPTPTAAPLQLEIVQSQVWTDYQGNARANVLLRNPYDFPVSSTSGSGVTMLNSAGEIIQGTKLYFLDGISGGSGFILPGETIAANACFTCEKTLLTEEWASIKFAIIAKDATELWNYSTEVEASSVNVSFAGDSPTFDITGTVKNNSDSSLQRISVRVIVFDQDGNLVGAGEVSAWNVGAGATANLNGYGIGQTPDGPVTYEITALGVNY
jgi:hypothetical protein